MQGEEEEDVIQRLFFPQIFFLEGQKKWEVKITIKVVRDDAYFFSPFLHVTNIEKVSALFLTRKEVFL